ncbi:MAG: hypothetical protein QOE14_420 [Humisphaera sp.]|nr:hypothetical protein [Humisphaera sp.]
MKTSNFVSLSVIAALMIGCAMKHAEPIRVMSFNIRVATADDGANQWMYRRDAVGAMLKAKQVDLLGLQEVRPAQLDDLVERLDGYAWVGVSRDGGKQGEFSPIFYRAKKFDLLAHGVFWLSEQPDHPTRGWDAAFPRVAMWAKFRARSTGRVFVMLNTHLDHRGKQARIEGTKLIVRRLVEISDGLPIILTGDLNSRLETEPYRLLTQPLRDARLVSRSGHTGPIETFTGFHGHPRPPGRPPTVTLDYILISPAVEVLRTETLMDDWEGRQMSDHRALLADLQL